MSSNTSLLAGVFNDIVNDALKNMPFLHARDLEKYLRLSLESYQRFYNNDLLQAKTQFSNNVLDWLAIAYEFQNSIKRASNTPNIDWQSIYKVITGMNYLELDGFDDLFGALDRPMMKDPSSFAAHFSPFDANIYNGYLNLGDDQAKPNGEKIELWGNPLIPIESRILLLSQDTLEIRRLVKEFGAHTFLPENIATKFGEYGITISTFYQSPKLPEFRAIFDTQNQICSVFDNSQKKTKTVEPLFP